MTTWSRIALVWPLSRSVPRAAASASAVMIVDKLSYRLPAPLGPSVVAMAPAITSEIEPEPTFDATEGAEELRAESDLLADCGAVALCAPLSSLEGSDPATRAAALHFARWFRARLSGQSADGATTPEKAPSTPKTTDDMDLCRGPPTMPLARKDSGGNDDWGAATCYGRTAMLRAGAGRDLAVPDGARLRPGGQSAESAGGAAPVRLCEISFSYRSKGRRLRERAPTPAPSSRRALYGAVSG